MFISPYVATPFSVARQMLVLVELKPGEVVYDLGSGDGRVAIMAAQEFGGNGHNWISDYHTEERSAFLHQYSFTTKLLPLHGLLFKSVDIKR